MAATHFTEGQEWPEHCCRHRLGVGLLMLLFLVTVGAAPDGVQAPVTGKISQENERTYFIDGTGRRLAIEGDAAICFKYANHKIEVLDPVYPVGDSIRFSRYRILESDNGEAIQTPERRIMSTRHLQPTVEFDVLQDGTELRFNLYVANSGSAPLKMRFPSTQKFDFVVMTTDEKTTLWRWSWGKDFDVGFNDVVLPPNSSTRFNGAWEFIKSYVDDGEYMAFAEINVLPHGILSERKKVILQASRQRVMLQQYFLPLEMGKGWVYRQKNADRAFEMNVTGTARLSGLDYFVLSGFPDDYSLGTATQNGDSRLVRFDAATSRYLEWTPGGEHPLLAADDTHRFIPASGPCATVAGRFDNCLEYRTLKDKKWVFLYSIVPGVGITYVFLPRADGSALELELLSTQAGSPKPQTTPKTAADPGDFVIRMQKQGGLPAVDTFYSLRSDGTYVVLEQGQITRQGIIGTTVMWTLIQVLNNEGFFKLAERYGDHDIVNPLEIVLDVRIGDQSRRVQMRTSAKDKPPQAFWKIVDSIESVIRKAS